jgi:hypothetical protein
MSDLHISFYVYILSYIQIHSLIHNPYTISLTNSRSIATSLSINNFTMHIIHSITENGYTEL